jgi:peptidyl-tRNA hydrolase, PTH1 family
MKIVVGLGNPGTEYRGSRHNVGFEVLAILARRWQAEKPRMRFSGECQEVFVNGQKLLMLSPMTYMNRSGECVQQAARFFRVPPEEIVVICDDMNLPTGRLRWKPSGSAGGQNGLDDILTRLGSRQVPRLRVGIGRPQGRHDATSWVLGRFAPDERTEMDLAVELAGDSVECWVSDGIGSTMNRFNTKGQT